MSGQKYLYLPLEIVIREHDGKTTLAQAAAADDWTVIMGPKLSLYNIADQLPEGVFLIKSATPLELKQIQALKKAGHKVCSLDEEGVVTFKEFLGENVRFGSDTVAEINQIFFWGREQEKSFKEAYPQFAERGHITGSPRLEFWRDYAAEVYREQAEKICKKYGHYILLPSSFGIANNVMGGDQGLQLTKKHSGKLTKELSQFMVGQAEQNLIAFREYLDFLPEIARAFPETNFVIRPHPSESHEAWNDLIKDFSNLHLVYEGSVTPWILSAAAIFHFKSTTSIEAHLMGRPVITYVPPFPPYMKKYELVLPIAVSQVSRTRAELLESLRQIISTENQKTPGTIDGVLKDWISADPAQTSASRLLSRMILEAPWPQRNLATPVESFRDQLRRRLEDQLVHAGRLPVIGKRLQKRLQHRLSGVAYGRRKYQGLDITHTKRVIDVIQKKSSNTAPISVTSFTDTLFIIKKSV